MSTSELKEARREAFEKIEPHISKTEKKILQGLQDYYRENGRHPLYTQLAEYVDMKHVSCNARLVKLRKKGYVLGFKNPKSKSHGTIQILTKRGAAVLLEVSNVS